MVIIIRLVLIVLVSIILQDFEPIIREKLKSDSPTLFQAASVSFEHTQDRTTREGEASCRGEGR